MGSKLKDLLNLYHLVNISLTLAFVVSKTMPLISTTLYGVGNSSSIDTREHEILIFLAIALIWKSRKSSNYLHFLSSVYLCSKFVNVFLFFRASILYGAIYTSLVLFCFVFVPEPVQLDSRKVRFFEADELHRTLEADKSIVWVIEFFTLWSRECRYIAPVFNELSESYTLPNLKFGKLDVGKYPREGERFRINTHVSSKQIPSISLFRGGTQFERRPSVKNDRAIPFVFSKENCIMAFDLNNLYTECKNKLRKSDKEIVKQHRE